MVATRLPGALCVITNALPVDAGTLVRAPTLPPGDTRIQVEEPSLNPHDRDFIDWITGRDISGAPLPLPALKASRDRHSERYAVAVREFGAHSQAALFERATVERLEELIAVAESPHGAAKEKLTKILADNPRGESDLSSALGDVLESERQRQRRGHPPDEDAKHPVAKALGLSFRRKKAKLEELVEAAKRPGNRVSDRALSKAVAVVLASERQMELLGIKNEHGVPTSELLEQVLDIAAERRTKQVVRTLDDFKRGRATEKQLSAACAGLLGIEREKQLLGAADDAGGTRTMELVGEALKAANARQRQNVRALIQQAQGSRPKVTQKQLRTAIQKLMSSERQEQLMGIDDDTDDDLPDLLEAATKLYGKLPRTPGAGGARKDRLEMPPLEIRGRLPGSR